MSNQEDAFKRELVKRGLLKDDKLKDLSPKTKYCLYCNHNNSSINEYCDLCKRPLDKDKIRLQLQNEERAKAELVNFFKPEAIMKLFESIAILQKEIEELKK